MVMIGFKAPDMFSKDYYKIQILTSILGSSFNGRLFKNIREKQGLAYSIGGSYIPALDGGYIVFYGLTESKNKFLLEKSMLEEIKKIQKNGIEEIELKNIKVYLKARQKEGVETLSGLSNKVSTDEIYGLGYNHYKQYDKKLDEVNKKHIQEKARELLQIDKSVILITENSVKKIK